MGYKMHPKFCNTQPNTDSCISLPSIGLETNLLQRKADGIAIYDQTSESHPQNFPQNAFGQTISSRLMHITKLSAKDCRLRVFLKLVPTPRSSAWS